MAKVKYIKTAENQIIVFPEYIQHIEFKKFNPISAGFIWINAEGPHELTCGCYGESISLKLKADEAVDSKLARDQILGYGYF